jgi:hypothetical protein
MEPLPFLEPLPDPLAVERVLTEQRRADDMLNDMRVGAIVSDDPEEALRYVVLGAGVSVALRVADDLRAIAEHLDGHVDNVQLASLSRPKPRRARRA